MPTHQMPTQWTLAFVGMGGVAREVWRTVQAAPPGDRLRQFHVTGVATRRGGILHQPDGVTPQQWQQQAAVSAGASSSAILAWLRTAPADILVELSSLQPRDGQPAIGYIRAALEAGMHVVTANKGPEAFAWRELLDLARRQQRAYRFESAVLDGLPVFRLPATMPGCRLQALEGILNSTTNLILTRMEDGLEYPEALLEAQQLGIAEANPAWDVDGSDAAMKACVLANVLLGAEMTPADVVREGIAGIGRQEIEAARRRGRVLRLIARVDGQGARVAPEEWPADHLYATIRGTSNVLTATFDRFGPLTLVESNPGLRQTAYGVLADLFSISAGDFWVLPPASLARL